jgi:hypothetical protein
VDLFRAASSVACVNPIVETLRYLSLAVFAAVLGRLALTGLLRRHKFFGLFLGVSVARSIFLMQYPAGTSAYAQVWSRTEPLIWAAFLLLTWEVHGISTAQYPGMRDFGRKLLMAFSAVAVLVAVASARIDYGAQPERWPYLALLGVIRRSLTSALFLFLAIEAGFFAFFPVPTQRNALLHQRMATFYFLTVTAGGLTFNLIGNPAITPYINIGSLSISAAVMLAWGLVLTASGEAAPAYRKRTLEESLAWKKKSDELELALKNWTAQGSRRGTRD